MQCRLIFKQTVIKNDNTISENFVTVLTNLEEDIVVNERTELIGIEWLDGQ